MLLTITYIGENACDLGYLLHKNPARPQVFALGFGKAYVFYPKADMICSFSAPFILPCSSATRRSGKT